jgi:hypothetical protein
MKKKSFVPGIAMGFILASSYKGWAKSAEGELKKGDTVLVTDESGNVVKGTIQESSAGGQRLSLVKAERFTLSRRIHAIPIDSTIAVTLKDGTGLRAPLAEVSSDGFALWVDTDETAQKAGRRPRTKKWVAYDDVYSVFDSGKLRLGKGVPLDPLVVNLGESRQVERVQPGSGGKGALLGFLAGAGVAALTSAGCCENPDYGPAEVFAIRAPVYGGIGAAIGYFAGKGSGGSMQLVHLKSPSESKELWPMPILERDRWGLAPSLRF